VAICWTSITFLQKLNCAKRVCSGGSTKLIFIDTDNFLSFYFQLTNSKNEKLMFAKLGFTELHRLEGDLGNNPRPIPLDYKISPAKRLKQHIDKLASLLVAAQRIY
jgi:hypothetical protein